MSNTIGARWLSVLAAGLILAVVAAFAVQASRDAGAQGNEAVMKAVIPAGEFKKGQQRIPVDITIENVTNMASFQFILQYNSEILEAAESTDPEQPVVLKGDFLGSSGRQVACKDPTVEPGAIQFLCVTLGPKPAGPDGSGKLATVYLNAIGSGKTTLTFDKVKSNHVDDSASEIPITAVNTPIEVQGDGGGMAWWVWALIVAGGLVVGLGAVGATMMMRSSGTKPA